MQVIGRGVMGKKIVLEPLRDTGKSLSEALIFASTNPQYDDRLFIELQVQYMKIPSSNLGKTCSIQKLFLTFRIFFVHNMFSPCSAKRKASDKDLPVTDSFSIRLYPCINIQNISILILILFQLFEGLTPSLHFSSCKYVSSMYTYVILAISKHGSLKK